MNILVTGGAGFIGSHLVRHLLAKGENVTALDNLSTGLAENLPPEAKLVEMDILDEELPKVVAAGAFDAIVHLAAQTMVDTSIKNPLLDTRENLLGTVQVLEAARAANVKRVIFASTAAAYGDVKEDDLPVREAQPTEPMSFYGLSKLSVEKYLEMYRKIYGMEYVVLRFANVYGERQGDGGEGGVISIFAKAVAEGRDITIYGDGEQTRDFVYAGDIAEGIWAALRTEEVNAAYNLSTQTETSLRELVSLLAEIRGREIVPKYGAEREGDIYKSMLSNSRARRGLDWQPATTLADGLRRTYEYFCGKCEG
ncbi:NAD-dependent epimerase/dehydratase family protein [uncultured Selenomonas sp.]|uniref:NAD-dependent epimerase/dehydratase family protein n=1 Tax=uncultured Selenomonas sp. TaxID=159275 RepID=UPI0028D655D9|nr:NAD-dependent epimerase/dehydratase family protein [uncultured Selenomonas sp.]